MTFPSSPSRLSVSRRRMLAGLAGAGLLPGSARALTPARLNPIKMIVPFGPGGLADVTVRIVAEALQQQFQQQTIVVNQPGAGGIAAAKAVLAASADGTTFGLFTNGTAISATLVPNAGFDPVADFVAVAMLGQFDFQIVTRREALYRTLGDVIAEARARPGTVNIGTISAGSTQHLTAALLRSTTGLDVATVAFRTTGDVLTAVLRGDVQIGIEGYAATKSMLAEGTLRALATTGPVRTRNLAEIPPVADAGVPGFDVTSWNAVFAAKATPEAAIAALNARINTVLALDSVQRPLRELGIETRALTPAATGARLAADIAKWADVIGRAGLAKP